MCSFVCVHVCVCVCVCECEHVCMTVSLKSPIGSKVTIQKEGSQYACSHSAYASALLTSSTASLVHFVMFHFLENRYRNIYIHSCLFC